eukprot:TRINITY_DN803_c0_g1_i1.p1 TRINITY_DN803_c0_g1~~TRINITY_DN803_c0_g1_i1.p1  ORF type:complete len:272 (-),score=77.22 TRINITY_DN803_c0_g1_i1:126-911(-)
MNSTLFLGMLVLLAASVACQTVDVTDHSCDGLVCNIAGTVDANPNDGEPTPFDGTFTYNPEGEEFVFDGTLGGYTPAGLPLTVSEADLASTGAQLTIDPQVAGVVSCQFIILASDGITTCTDKTDTVVGAFVPEVTVSMVCTTVIDTTVSADDKFNRWAFGTCDVGKVRRLREKTVTDAKIQIRWKHTKQELEEFYLVRHKVNDGGEWSDKKEIDFSAKKKYTAKNLIPMTEYKFEVTASSSDLGSGKKKNIKITTAAAPM